MGRSGPDGDDGDDLAADLARLVGDARQLEESRARAHERHLRAAASAEATLAGVVLDLAEQLVPVSVRMTSGRLLHGRVSVVATDVLVLESGAGISTYLQVRHVTWIRPATDAGGRPSAEPSGRRPPPRATTFTALVAELAAHRPRVSVMMLGEDVPLRGELRASGTDVLTVFLDGDPPVAVFLATAQVSELTVLASG